MEIMQLGLWSGSRTPKPNDLTEAPPEPDLDDRHWVIIIKWVRPTKDIRRPKPAWPSIPLAHSLQAPKANIPFPTFTRKYQQSPSVLSLYTWHRSSGDGHTKAAPQRECDDDLIGFRDWLVKGDRMGGQDAGHGASAYIHHNPIKRIDAGGAIAPRDDLGV
ncbi:hypothetical protein B0F90DRAFT_1671459 [Multifurca ochricompacta]|uniref:Uncharacterized protein n=1 Tax=Multifurca ochricompacta TaxID=376703 RepID=A0AAD4LVD0_9AGAM|nr:hypothetical protein B0F90DRAFT_1671459 [Multifurca ochricompacta]